MADAPPGGAVAPSEAPQATSTNTTTVPETNNASRPATPKSPGLNPNAVPFTPSPPKSPPPTSTSPVMSTPAADREGSTPADSTLPEADTASKTETPPETETPSEVDTAPAAISSPPADVAPANETPAAEASPQADNAPASEPQAAEPSTAEKSTAPVIETSLQADSAPPAENSAPAAGDIPETSTLETKAPPAVTASTSDIPTEISPQADNAPPSESTAPTTETPATKTSPQADNTPPSEPTAPTSETLATKSSPQADNAPPSSPTAPKSSSTPTPTPPTPKPNNLLSLLRARLLLLARKTDAHLSHLTRLLSTPRGIDVTLCTFSYTLSLLSALLTRHLNNKLTHLAVSVAAAADPLLLPGETLLTSMPTPPSLARLSKIATSTKALYALIADFRIFARLWGMLAMYAWGKSYLQSPLAADAGRRDRILRGIQGAQVASLGVYQGLENAAYLASKGVLTSAGWQGEKGKARENRAWLWSCRLWAAYVVLEGVRLGVEWRYSDRDGEKGDKVARETANRLWWRDLVSNAAYFPMTLHWSVDGGVLSDVGVGLCGIFAGGANLVEAWRATA